MRERINRRSFFSSCGCVDGNVVMTAPAISPFSRRLKVVLPKSSSPFISETQKVVASIDDNWFVGKFYTKGVNLSQMLIYCVF